MDIKLSTSFKSSSLHSPGRVIILGRFNLHHELWGRSPVQYGDVESQERLGIFGDYQLDSLLPAGTVTFEDRNAQSYINLCYGTSQISDRVIRCGVDHEELNNYRDRNHVTVQCRRQATLE
jgi:hypothetical protein